MITIFLLAISGLAFVFSTIALAAALTAKDVAEQALDEHAATLDAADELFEDHEERINELEFRSPAQPTPVVVGGNITGGGVTRE